MRSISSIFILAGASLLPIAAAQAQDAAATEASSDILVVGRSDPGLNRPTSTGSRLGLTPLELPASISTVDGDAIRARGDLSVAEAVSRAPGITNAADNGNGGTALAARGFVGPGSVLQLVDGIRQFPIAGSVTFPNDPWNVARIEVLTGPASVLYGQGALGGAINVITKQPGTAQSLDLEGSYGSQNTVHLAAGAGGPVDDTLGYRIDGSYRRSDGWVDRGGNSSIALGGSLRYAPTDTFSLTARVDYADVRPQEYWGTPLIDGRLDTSIRHRNFNVGDADIVYKDDRELLVAQWSPSSNVTIANSAYRIHSNRQWYDLELYCWIGPSGDCPNGGGSGTPGRIFRNSNLGIIQQNNQIGNLATVAIKSPLGGSIANDLVVGFDVNRIKLRYSNNFAVANQADEVDPRNFDPGTLENRADTIPRYRTRTSEWSVFAEDRLKLAERFSIVGGFRYEEDTVRRRSYVYGPGNVPGGTVNAFPGGATRKRFSDFTWRAGAVFQPTPTLSLYGQYSTGVDPVGTLTTFTTNAVQFAFSNAKGDQIEAGVKASFLNGRGSATLAAYKIVKKNLSIQRITNGPIEQIGQQSSKGIEAAVSLVLPSGFGIEANGTVLDAQYDRFNTTGTDVNGNDVLISYRGNTAPNVPETAANLWLTWEGLGGIRAQAGLRYVGRRFSDSANAFRIPSYAVVDLGLSYAFNERVAIDLRAYNLFDKDYAVSAYDNEQWVLGRPQSFDVALRAKF